MTPRVGAVLADRYELVAHIARGGMGDVYEGTDRLLERQVAVKVYRAASPADRDRFDREVRCLASLNHPGLVQVYDAGPHGDDAFVVLELIDGSPLSVAFDHGVPLPPARVAGLGAEIADALDYIHQHGVVHRDVTPANILCGPDGRARLVDFGIVRLLDSPRVTAGSIAVGTAAYMAPEQVQGLEVTPAADVYALGLLLLQALTGRREFVGSMQEVAMARLLRQPDTATDVPPEWQALLTRMTSQDPGSRPTAAAVRQQLDLLAGAHVQATVPVPVIDGTAADSAADLATSEQIGGTAVLPAMAYVPGAPTAASRGTRRYWAAGVGLAAAFVTVLVLAANAGTKPPASPTTVTSVTSANTSQPAVTHLSPIARRSTTSTTSATATTTPVVVSTAPPAPVPPTTPRTAPTPLPTAPPTTAPATTPTG